MSARAHGDPDPPPSVSPHIWDSPDFQGRIIRITIEHDNATRAITGVTTFRDADCVYKKILVGLGANGTPDSTGHAFTCPAGTHSIPVQQMTAQGFSTIEQFQALQITAGR